MLFNSFAKAHLTKIAFFRSIKFWDMMFPIPRQIGLVFSRILRYIIFLRYIFVNAEKQSTRKRLKKKKPQILRRLH